MRQLCLACRKVEAGDCFGEIAFFTEAPQLETVRTVRYDRVGPPCQQALLHAEMQA